MQVHANQPRAAMTPHLPHLLHLVSEVQCSTFSSVARSEDSQENANPPTHRFTRSKADIKPGLKGAFGSL